MARAELTWVPGSVPGWFIHPKMVTHPGTNRAWCRVIVLIESNVLPLLYTDSTDAGRVDLAKFPFQGDFNW